MWQFKNRVAVMLVALLFGGAIGLFYLYSGFQISYSEPPAPDADLLYTLGMAPERYRFSESLYQKSVFNRWLISDPFAYVGERLIAKGFSADEIDLYLTAESTVDEIRYLRFYLKEKGYRENQTVTIVSSRSHLGRVRLLCRRFGVEKNIECNYVAVSEQFETTPKPQNYYSNWWLYSNLRKETFNFMTSFLIYWW
jgi:hypothetical protein